MATARRIDYIFQTTASLVVTFAALSWVQRNEQRGLCGVACFGGLGTSPMPATCLDEGFSRVKHALLAENARSTELPTDFRLPHNNSSTPAHPPPPKRAQNYKIDSTLTGDKEGPRRRSTRIQPKKSPVGKGPLRLVDPTVCKNWPFRVLGYFSTPEFDAMRE